VAVPGSTYSTYATPVMVTKPGGPLNFMNFDLPQHDVVSDDKGPDGHPLFQSKLSGLGELAPIEGLDRLKSGQTYGFFCSLHPGMRGNLIVQ
jgi:plastocyanin